MVIGQWEREMSLRHAIALLAVMGTVGVARGDGGVEQATGMGDTRADACNMAIRSASLAAETNVPLLLRLNLRVSRKWCEHCERDARSGSALPEWNCLGYVQWSAGQ